ncbi:hypothetical protein FFF34_015330 [Inquilinus sp. KBS0705]|nr:hypothetical protein FFF34_015330 [Inquilinus sp. KBS0705]
MEIYKLSPEGNAQLKKVWLITVLGAMVAITAVFAFNLLYRGGTDRDMAYFAIIVSAEMIAFYFGRKKYFLVTDSTRLMVYDDKVTLHTSNQPDVTIELANIKKITRRKKGVFLVNRITSKPSLFIMDKFENFEEIEGIIEAKTGLVPTAN